MIQQSYKIFMMLVLVLTSKLVYASPEDVTSTPPFRIAGNLYYLASENRVAPKFPAAIYMLATSKGLILINSGDRADPAIIKDRIQQLGFNFNDIKIILIGHGHADHDAGSAEIKKMTGATYMVMAEDRSIVESGGKTDFQYGKDPTTYTLPVKVDRVLHDNDKVSLGKSTLIAHLTPGHTKGSVTWTTQVSETGKIYNVVILGSVGVNPGYKLLNNVDYPKIAADYQRSFRVLKTLPCDIFLGAHDGFFRLAEKYAQLKKGVKNPFLDKEGYKKYVARKEKEFSFELAKQKAALGVRS